MLSVPRILEELGVGHRVRISSLYETEPIECAAMAAFINAVVEFETLLYPWDLLKRLKTIEKATGRTGGHREPRELDLDIVAMGTCVFRSETLSVPHPRYQDRAFVLIPLREVASHFTCPATGRHIDDLIASLVGGQRLVVASSRKTLFA